MSEPSEVVWTYPVIMSAGVAGLGLVVNFWFNVCNWRRTGGVNRRVQQNNRATRFEAVHGQLLNSTLADLRSVSKEVNTNLPSITSVQQAKTFAKKTLRTKINSAQHSLVMELGSLKDSDLSRSISNWNACTDNLVWDDIEKSYAALLGATSVVDVTRNLTDISHSVISISNSITVAREYENSLE